MGYSRLSCRPLAVFARCEPLYLSVYCRSPSLMLDLGLHCTVTVVFAGWQALQHARYCSNTKSHNTCLSWFETFKSVDLLMARITASLPSPSPLPCVTVATGHEKAFVSAERPSQLCHGATKTGQRVCVSDGPEAW